LTVTVDTDKGVDVDVLESIERRMLWLAVRIVDYANHDRPSLDRLKVGGHQASSASMVSLLTALYVADLRAEDRVSIKPHASPALHAAEYLLGRLERPYLTRLRDFGGLQSYPSRLKDPIEVDYSTGSVGLGSAAPLFGALADRYVSTRLGKATGGRYISLLGDAELDEGNIWEALAEPLTRQLGNVLWIVDLNRQSLDRVVPGVRAAELERQFANFGWNVIELKYGRRLREAFARRGGHLLRGRIDEMPNEQYQALFAADSDDQIRETLLQPLAHEDRTSLEALLDDCTDLRRLIQDLGGHDVADILDAFSQARSVTDRPSVVFAYTIKGYGLEIAGRPQNHSALLSRSQIASMRDGLGLTSDSEWDRFPPDSPEACALRDAAARLERGPRPRATRIQVPKTLAGSHTQELSTPAAFGRALLELTRVEGLSERLVTVAPDVSISTSLGGFINKMGVWNQAAPPVYDSMNDSPLQWRVGPSGQHIEIGIAEMNLVLLLGQLGLTWDSHGEWLCPVGTLYDPFVMRALEGIFFSVYQGARFVLAGTPSGISLGREGGAHQSVNTPGIGIETPGLVYCEPAYATELEWLLLDAIASMQSPEGQAVYLRLSTKPIDQAPFADLVARRGPEAVRRDVVAGGVRLKEPHGGHGEKVILATCGAMAPEVLSASEYLREDEGVDSVVLLLSSADRLYHGWQRASTQPLRDGLAPEGSALSRLVGPAERGAPVVTVIDGSSHALAWLGSALGSRCVPLGVSGFGQTGSQQELYRAYEIDAESIVTAALVALEPER
jgi:pyruvate dehydrogenase E1 component